MNIKTLFICTGVSNIILSNMQALWGRIEKILNLFLIDLNEVHLDAILSSIDGHRVLVTIRIRLREDYTSVLCHYLKHGRDGTWYYAVLFTTCLISAYRIGLSRTLFTYIYICIRSDYSFIQCNGIRIIQFGRKRIQWRCSRRTCYVRAVARMFRRALFGLSWALGHSQMRIACLCLSPTDSSRLLCEHMADVGATFLDYLMAEP